MSDGQSDYLAQIVNEHYRQSRAYWAKRLAEDSAHYDRPVRWFPTDRGGWIPNRGLSLEEYRENPPPIDAPIVPRRVTEYGRLIYEGDLGLPINTTPAYFWLGKDAEASDAGIR